MAANPLWGRSRLLGILAAVVAVALLMAVGLGYGLWNLVAGAPGSAETPSAAAGSGSGQVATGQTPQDPGYAASTQGSAHGPGHRDDIAAAPMLRVPAEAAPPPEDRGQTEGQIEGKLEGKLDGEGSGIAQLPGQIAIPTATDPGPANVLTGFPRTPEGAVAQLAQIEVTVLQAMSLPGTGEVYRAWALPGSAAVHQWRLTAAVAGFLHAAGMDQAKDPTATVTATPAAGLVKGADGPDWVLACVLIKVTAIYVQQSQTSFGHCERMQWAGGRWLIAPGPPPSPAPSTWPGSRLAAQAGWRTWRTRTQPGARRGAPTGAAHDQQ